MREMMGPMVPETNGFAKSVTTAARATFEYRTKDYYRGQLGLFYPGGESAIHLFWGGLVTY